MTEHEEEDVRFFDSVRARSAQEWKRWTEQETPRREQNIKLAVESGLPLCLMSDRRHAPRTRRCIYALANATEVKFGITTNLIPRWDSLERERRTSLHLLAVAEGDRASERLLHSVFKDHCVAGEWFRRNPCTERAAYVIRSLRFVPSEHELRQALECETEAALADLLLRLRVDNEARQAPQSQEPSPTTTPETAPNESSALDMGADAAVTEHLDRICPILDAIDRELGWSYERERMTYDAFGDPENETGWKTRLLAEIQEASTATLQRMALLEAANRESQDDELNALDQRYFRLHRLFRTLLREDPAMLRGGPDHGLVAELREEFEDAGPSDSNLALSPSHPE